MPCAEVMTCHPSEDPSTRLKVQAYALLQSR
jgi:hypothetical protein